MDEVFARYRTSWRRLMRHGRLGRGTTTIVAVIVTAVAVGSVLAVYSSQGGDSFSQAALGSCIAGGTAGSPAADPAADPGGSPAAYGSPAPVVSCPPSTASPTSPSTRPTTSHMVSSRTSGSAGRRVPVVPYTYASGPTAQWQLGDVATAPVDGNGNPVNLHQSPPQAAASMNCTLVVPANPLTPRGLATPYQLGDGCSEANPNLQAFAEATILSPDGHVTVYNPLVITQGTVPAIAPVPPKVPFGSKVILDFGFNGTDLVLTGPGTRQASSGCVDALGQSVIGQVSACDAVPFYKLADAEIARGILRVPSVGRALDGQPCQDTRNFALIDQDPSDNTYTQYLLDGNGQTAQPTPAGKAALSSAMVISNGSDNGLLGYFVDPANGCQPFAAPDPTSANGSQSSQALDELSSRMNQKTQIADIPPNDEMVLVNGGYSVAKTNVYRSIVDQPLLPADTNATEVAAAFCMNMVNIAPAHNLLDMGRDANFTSAVPAVGDNLATFMGNRLAMSFANLGCQNFGLTNPVTVTVDGNGVATMVTYNTAHQQATIPAADAGQAPVRSMQPQRGRHDRRHMHQNPSGM